MSDVRTFYRQGTFTIEGSRVVIYIRSKTYMKNPNGFSYKAELTRPIKNVDLLYGYSNNLDWRLVLVKAKEKCKIKLKEMRDEK